MKKTICKVAFGLVLAVFVIAQVPSVPNTDFPTFRSNLNASLAKAANITMSYADPVWITSLAWSKITGAPSTLGPTGPTGPTGPAGASGPSGSQFVCTVTSVSSIACTHNLNTANPNVACYDGSNNVLGGASASTSITDVTGTSTSIATITFSGTTSGKCIISNGGGNVGAAGATGPTGPTGPTGASGAGTGTINSGSNPQIAQYVGASSTVVGGATISGDATLANGGAVTLAAPSLIRTCFVAIGDPGAASTALANDNDAPVACSNNYGSDWTLDTVACWADAGSPTITPILTGGTGTSILSGALTCGTAAWLGSATNSSPVIHTFSGAAMVTCSSTPCTADVNITTAGGTAKYIQIKIVGHIVGH